VGAFAGASLLESDSTFMLNIGAFGAFGAAGIFDRFNNIIYIQSGM